MSVLSRSLSMTGLPLLALVPLAAAWPAAASEAADAVSLPASSAAHASSLDSGAAATLDALVVVADGEPGNFALDREEVEFTLASDAADLLANESGVAVGGGSPVAQKIYVRGFEDTMLNVTVDGAPQPAELYHHQARVQIEPEFIQRVELHAGAGPATQGAGAVTGALRVETRDAFDLLREDQRLGLLLKGVRSLGGPLDGKGVAAVYGRLGEGVGLLATVVRHHGNDYRDGHGERVSPTAFEHERRQARLTGKFDAHHVDLTTERIDDNGTYYERPHMGNFAGRFELSDHRMLRDTARYRHEYAPGSEAVDLAFDAYRTRSRYENHRNNTGALYGRGDQLSRGFDLRNSARWAGLDWVTGLGYRRDELHARQQATPPPFWADTLQQLRLFGAYAQMDWEPSRAWRVSGGLRYDHYDHQVDAGPGAGAENTASRVSPNLSLEWSSTPQLTWRAAYAQAFRGVTIREAFFSALYAHRGDLEGEVADNLELGVAWEQDGAYLRATAFRQRIEHFINAVYVGTPDAWGYWENTGTARVRGYEAEAGKAWERLTLGLGVWDSEGRLDDRPLNDSDLGLGTSIGRTWTVRADWRPASSWHWGLRGRYVEREPNTISPTAPDKPAYAVLDALARWSVFDDDRLAVGLAVHNVFDRFYYDHATYSYHPGSGRFAGFAAPGREWRLSLTWKL